MKRSSWIVAIGVALAMMASQATFSEATQENSQQEKMKTCNADAKAKALKGDERRAFMKSCLSEHGTEAATTASSQQEKMKTCNADAKTKGLKGAERKEFMKSCLSGSASK